MHIYTTSVHENITKIIFILHVKTFLYLAAGAVVLLLFPAFVSEAHNSKYEWQGVAYMLLYNKPLFELVYCMVSTADDLLSDWDNKSIHQVDHIEPAKRITVLKYERDVEKEEYMNEKLVHASMFYAMCIAELNDK